MRSKLHNNDFKIQTPSTWLGRLFERLKRFLHPLCTAGLHYQTT